MLKKGGVVRNKVRYSLIFDRNDNLDIEYQLDIYNEFARYADIGIDGAFVDFPATYRRALELLYPEEVGDNEGEECPNAASQLTNSLAFLCFIISFKFLFRERLMTCRT